MVRTALVLVVLAGLGAATRALAEAPPTAEDLARTVEALKQRNRELERRLGELETRIGEGTDAQRLRREEVRAIVEQMLAEAKADFKPGWLENLTFYGDLRLRFEHRARAAEQRDDDHRYRYRLRFGFTKTWPQDDLEVGFRIVTGADDDPTSTNQTFEDLFEEHEIGFDLAYAQWTPRAVKGLRLVAGKMKQPWKTTDIVWDSDVNPEGAWLAYQAPAIGPVTPFVGGGYFTLTYNDANQPEANLAAYEAGLTIALPCDVKWTASVALYDYVNVNPNIPGVGGFAARGNTFAGGRLLAEDFDLVTVTNSIAFKAFNLPWTATTDFVHNFGNHDAAGRSDGYAFGLRVGSAKKKGDWSFGYTYKYIEADATLAWFNDSDFGNGSHTNRKGHVWKATYMVTDAMEAGLTLFATQPIDTDYPGGPAEHDRTRFTFQADLVWKF